MIRERTRHKKAAGFQPEWYRMRQGTHVTANMKRITVGLEAATFRELADLAAEGKRPVSALIREAIDRYLKP